MNSTTHNNLVKLTKMIAFNSYLVREDDGITVIDTNLPGSADDILAAVRAIGGDIKRIVITHTHTDHVASLDALHALVPDAEVIASEREAALMQGDMTLRPGEAADQLRGSYVQPTTQPTRLVNDGDMIGSLRVIAAPGHTPGHIALLDTRDNTLIAGDALVTQFGTTVTGKLNILFPFPALATWNKPTALATARTLLELKPSLLAVGHGKVLTNPVSAMQQAIASAEQSFNVN